MKLTLLLLLTALPLHSLAMEQKATEPSLLSLIRNNVNYQIIEKEVTSSNEINSEYNGTTPLLEAIKHRREDVVNLLHIHGANLEQAVKENTLTPLTQAIELNDYSMVKLLVSLGAPVTSHTCYSPLSVAHRVREEILQQIIRYLLIDTDHDRNYCFNRTAQDKLLQELRSNKKSPDMNTINDIIDLLQKHELQNFLMH